MNQMVLKKIIIKSKNKRVQKERERKSGGMRERERGGAFWSFHKERREKSGVKGLGG